MILKVIKASSILQISQKYLKKINIKNKLEK